MHAKHQPPKRRDKRINKPHAQGRQPHGKPQTGERPGSRERSSQPYHQHQTKPSPYEEPLQKDDFFIVDEEDKQAEHDLVAQQLSQ
jgi:hypothetical protein